MIKNIIFDMGNVLVRFDPELFMDRYSLTGEDRKLIRNEVFRSVEWTMLDRGVIDEEIAEQRILPRLPERLHDAACGLIEKWDDPIVPVEGMLEFLQALKAKGYRLYLLSNAATRQPIYWARAETSKLMDGAPISAEVKLLKPDPQIYRAFLHKFALRPEECVFIDDTPINVEGALYENMAGIVFNMDVAALAESLHALGVEWYAPKGFADTFPGLQRMPDTELTMLTLENPSTQALRKLLPEFEHRSGIRVKLIGVPYDDLLAQLKLIGPHFTYDMIRIDVAQFGDIGQSIYRPLDELSISPEGLSPRLIKNGYDSYSMLNGRVYALPLDPSVQIFLYRTDLFHDAKLCRAYYERFHENLVVPTTYEQYLHAAEFFTRSCNPDSPTEYGTTMTCGSASVAASDFLPFYLSRIDRFGTTPGTLRLDCPEMQAAMRQYHALEKFSCKQNWWGDSIQKFADGKTAMTVIYSNYAAELINSGNSVVVGRVGAAILPGCKPLLGGGIVGISRYSQKAEACKQFFRWYYSADVASLLVRLGGTSPIVDAYEDFQNYSIFPWMNTSKKSFGLGQRGVKNQIPERFSIPKYEFAVGTAIRNVVQDLMTPEDASRMAQALYDAADPISR